MKELFCVIADTNGAHEAESVYSIWETKSQAQQEIERLKTNHIEPGCYGGKFHVKEVFLNKNYDEWIKA